MEATDVQVGFAQLVSPIVAAAAIADGIGVGVAIDVVVGAWRSHLMVGGGHIRLLQKKVEGRVRSEMMQTFTKQKLPKVHDMNCNVEIPGS